MCVCVCVCVCACACICVQACASGKGGRSSGSCDGNFCKRGQLLQKLSLLEMLHPAPSAQDGRITAVRGQAWLGWGGADRPVRPFGGASEGACGGQSGEAASEDRAHRTTAGQVDSSIIPQGASTPGGCVSAGMRHHSTSHHSMSHRRMSQHSMSHRRMSQHSMRHHIIIHHGSDAAFLVHAADSSRNLGQRMMQ
jgi:hypothetical protein